MKINKSFIKTYGLPILCIALLVGTFWGGFTFGKEQNSYKNNSLNIFSVASASSTDGSIDLSTFWKVWNILDKKFVATKEAKIANDQDKIWGAIEGMTASYGDPYTVFMPPEETKNFNQDISGDFEGIGMEVGIKDGILTVIAPLKGTPAAKAGILAGDKIAEINGTSTQDMSADEAVKLIRGKRGTEVKLKIAREGEKDFMEIIVVRDVITIPTVDTEIKDGVFIIHLYNFYANSASLFRNAVKEFVDSGSSKMILDLRNNPGGYLDSAVDIASWYLPLGKVVVSEVGKNPDDEKVHRATGHQVFNDKLKLAILVNNGSASASEILAGALRDHGLAKIIGVNTFGKGSVQEVVKIGQDASLKVTIARWFTPKGYSISEGGLKPDYEVKITDDDRTKGKDPQMEKALEVVNKK